MKKGFTIVELLIYISISIIVLFGLTDFVISINQAKKRGVIISEVENQGLQIVNIITQKIRNADTINFPSAGTNGSSLSLVMVSPNPSPIAFDINSGVLRITESGGSPIALNNNVVSVSDLVFSNLSRVSTPGVIKFQFKLKYNSPSTGTIYNYEKIFYATGSLR